MERNRDHAIRAREDAGARVSISAASGRGERAAPFVLQGVHDLAQRAVVRPGGRARVHDRAAAAAARASRHQRVGDAPRCQRIAAASAERGGERQDRLQQAPQTGPRVG